jgi:hypothetical protein
MDAPDFFDEPQELGILTQWSVVVTTSAIAGSQVEGISGALSGAPGIAIGREILRSCYCRILDQDPFRAEELPPKEERHSAPRVAQSLRG